MLHSWHSFRLFKPTDEFRCDLANILVGSKNTPTLCCCCFVFVRPYFDYIGLLRLPLSKIIKSPAVARESRPQTNRRTANCFGTAPFPHRAVNNHRTFTMDASRNFAFKMEAKPLPIMVTFGRLYIELYRHLQSLTRHCPI